MALLLRITYILRMLCVRLTVDTTYFDVKGGLLTCKSGRCNDTLVHPWAGYRYWSCNEISFEANSTIPILLSVSVASVAHGCCVPIRDRKRFRHVLPRPVSDNIDVYSGGPEFEKDPKKVVDNYN